MIEILELRALSESFDNHLARVAYEAYAKWQDAAEYPEFELLPEAERQRWLQVAAHVVMEST